MFLSYVREGLKCLAHRTAQEQSVSILHLGIECCMWENMKTGIHPTRCWGLHQRSLLRSCCTWWKWSQRCWGRDPALSKAGGRDGLGGDPWAHPSLSAGKDTRATSSQGELLPNRLAHPAGASWMQEHVVGPGWGVMENRTLSRSGKSSAWVNFRKVKFILEQVLE